MNRGAKNKISAVGGVRLRLEAKVFNCMRGTVMGSMGGWWLVRWAAWTVWICELFGFVDAEL